jgi:hypothetical protein
MSTTARYAAGWQAIDSEPFTVIKRDNPWECMAELLLKVESNWDKAYDEIGEGADEIYAPIYSALRNSPLPFEQECNGVLYWAKAIA